MFLAGRNPLTVATAISTDPCRQPRYSFWVGRTVPSMRSIVFRSCSLSQLRFDSSKMSFIESRTARDSETLPPRLAAPGGPAADSSRVPARAATEISRAIMREKYTRPPEFP